MKKVLFVNPFGIGDALFTLALAQTLRKANPSLGIGFLGNERTVELMALCPALDQTHCFNRDFFRNLWKTNKMKFFSEFFSFWNQIRSQKYDTLLDFSLGWEFAFYAMLSGIRRRIGFDYRGRGIFLTEKARLGGYDTMPVIDGQYALLQTIDKKNIQGLSKPEFEISESSRRELWRFLGEAGIVPGEAILALAPGGGRSWGSNARYKQWDPERFAAAARSWEAHSGHRVILLGDSAESEVLQNVSNSLLMRPAVLMGLPMALVCAALTESKVLLCNDGGLLHLADALGVRTVSLFGPVNERVYGPYWQTHSSTVLTTDVSCRPCYRNFHFPPCHNDRRCLTTLAVDRVIAALEKMA